MRRLAEDEIVSVSLSYIKTYAARRRHVAGNGETS
jgi:hypothetical protein